VEIENVKMPGRYITTGETIMNWQKPLLLAAATWNVLGGASALIDPAQHFAQMYTASLSLDQPLQLFFYRGVWINVIAWGIAYFIAAFVPTARVTVFAAGAVGKFAYFVACVALFSSGVGNAALLATGLADLVFATLFAIAVLQMRKTNDAVQRWGWHSGKSGNAG
jgi:hypothetical protein